MNCTEERTNKIELEDAWWWCDLTNSLAVRGFLDGSGEMLSSLLHVRDIWKPVDWLPSMKACFLDTNIGGWLKIYQPENESFKNNTRPKIHTVKGEMDFYIFPIFLNEKAEYNYVNALRTRTRLADGATRSCMRIKRGVPGTWKHLSQLTMYHPGRQSRKSCMSWRVISRLMFWLIWREASTSHWLLTSGPHLPMIQRVVDVICSTDSRSWRKVYSTGRK